MYDVHIYIYIYVKFKKIDFKQLLSTLPFPIALFTYNHC